MSQEFQDFINQLSAYYGVWENPQVPEVILSYLKRDIDPDRLKILFRYVCYTHPARFGPPSVAEIEEAIFRKCVRGGFPEVRNPRVLAGGANLGGSSPEVPPDVKKPVQGAFLGYLGRMTVLRRRKVKGHRVLGKNGVPGGLPPGSSKHRENRKEAK